VVDLQVYVNSVTGTGPPRCPDTQSSVLLINTGKWQQVRYPQVGCAGTKSRDKRKLFWV